MLASLLTIGRNGFAGVLGAAANAAAPGFDGVWVLSLS